MDEKRENVDRSLSSEAGLKEPLSHLQMSDKRGGTILSYTFLVYVCGCA